MEDTLRNNSAATILTIENEAKLTASSFTCIRIVLLSSARRNFASCCNGFDFFRALFTAPNCRTVERRWPQHQSKFYAMDLPQKQTPPVNSA